MTFEHIQFESEFQSFLKESFHSSPHPMIIETLRAAFYGGAVAGRLFEETHGEFEFAKAMAQFSVEWQRGIEKKDTS